MQLAPQVAPGGGLIEVGPEQAGQPRARPRTTGPGGFLFLQGVSEIKWWPVYRPETPYN